MESLCIEHRIVIWFWWHLSCREALQLVKQKIFVQNNSTLAETSFFNLFLLGYDFKVKQTSINMNEINHVVTVSEHNIIYSAHICWRPMIIDNKLNYIHSNFWAFVETQWNSDEWALQLLWEIIYWPRARSLYSLQYILVWT